MLSLTSSHRHSSANIFNNCNAFVQLLEALNPQKRHLKIDILPIYSGAEIENVSIILK